MVLKRFGLLCLLLTSLLGITACMEPPDPPPGYLIGPPSLSPDGRFIAFTYGSTVQDNRLLLYDIANDALRLMPKPARVLLFTPSFSPDGRNLVVSTFCRQGCSAEQAYIQIATMDIASDELRFVTSGRNFVRRNPIFSRNGGKIFFGSSRLEWRENWLEKGLKWDDDWGEARQMPPHGLSSVDLSSQEEVRFLPTADLDFNFSSIGPRTETRAGDLYLMAGVPQDGDLKSAIATASRVHDLNLEYTQLGYVLRSSGQLELLEQNALGPMHSLTSSADGKRLVFISSPPDDRFSYDLYQLVDGRVSQVSNLRTHMDSASVSADGGRIVFLADATRQRNWSVWLHDYGTGKTRPVVGSDSILTFLQTQVGHSTQSDPP